MMETMIVRGTPQDAAICMGDEFTIVILRKVVKAVGAALGFKSRHYVTVDKKAST
jgi:hypothetical protein